MNSNFLCSECASCFRERWELTSHTKNIHDTRVFKCPICDENIQNFRECFEVVHELFDVSETQKIHVILNHYSDYFEMRGKIFKEANCEHHEALHHTLKTMEKIRVYI